MTAPHDKIIANAAKLTLQPLGLRRKGQSRIWLGDHGWWLTVVEFQPSGFRKGSYLNVAAHWLWSESGFISFDFGCGADWGSRVAGFEEYVSEEQFGPAAHRLAAAAVEQVQELVRRFPTIQAAAELLLGRESGLSEQGQGSWSTYNAGIAAGIADRDCDADTVLRSVTDDRVRDAAEQFLRLVPEPSKFMDRATALIAAQRKALRLPELNSPPF